MPRSPVPTRRKMKYCLGTPVPNPIHAPTTSSIVNGFFQDPGCSHPRPTGAPPPPAPGPGPGPPAPRAPDTGAPAAPGAAATGADTAAGGGGAGGAAAPRAGPPPRPPSGASIVIFPVASGSHATGTGSGSGPRESRYRLLWNFPPRGAPLVPLTISRSPSNRALALS